MWKGRYCAQQVLKILSKQHLVPFPLDRLCLQVKGIPHLGSIMQLMVSFPFYPWTWGCSAIGDACLLPQKRCIIYYMCQLFCATAQCCIFVHLQSSSGRWLVLDVDMRFCYGTRMYENVDATEGHQFSTRFSVLFGLTRELQIIRIIMIARFRRLRTCCRFPIVVLSHNMQCCVKNMQLKCSSMLFQRFPSCYQRFNIVIFNTDRNVIQ